MSKERQSSYFLRTQSTILNGEKQINFNSFRDQIIVSKKASNRKYLSSGSNNKKNRRYISKNQKNDKQNKKKSYIGIDLQKVSGATHLYNNKSKDKFNKNKIPKGNSLNYYKYLSKKNKPTKEEEKNINETNIKNICKSNNYSPFHNIITNIKDKNNTNNVIHRNNDNLNDVNKYLIKTNSSKDNYYKEENMQYFSNNDENNIEKEETNEINNNLNYTKTYNFSSNNHYLKPNDTRLTYTYNKYNKTNTNNKGLYLNNKIIKADLINNKDCLVDKIKNITKANPYNINYISNNKFKNQNTNIKISKSYSLTNYNYNINDPNSGYTPLPYKSFLKSIFDQNYTNKFIKDFNAFSSSRKIEKNKFEYDKNNENNLKKMLEGVPRHLRQKNKSEIYFVNDNNINSNYNSKNRRMNFFNLNKNSKSNNKKNNFELINNIMPPNKLKENEKEN